jgi:hypothetical protein
MGYTHYWRDHPITQEKWNEKIPLVQKVIDKYRDIIQLEFDDPSPPLVNSDVIRFNGVGYSNSGESFIFERERAKFNFCKTGRYDYDTPVLLVLMVMSDIIPFSSDGDLDDFPLSEYNEIFGERWEEKTSQCYG